LPNPLGIYDMHGNAWEWVADCYDEGAYSRRKELTIDPLETSSCWGPHVIRGGSHWDDNATNLHSAHRHRPANLMWRLDFGFRCVRGPHRQP
jgi:formylglycine-generating enzyme required for sulfatase activity